MDQPDKKNLSCAPMPKKDKTEPTKQTSGDKQFDEAIDKLLKKPQFVTPTK
jgi:hypothetical protein